MGTPNRGVKCRCGMKNSYLINISMGTPNRGIKCRCGMKNSYFDQCLTSLHVNNATVRCYKESAARQWHIGDTYRW